MSSCGLKGISMLQGLYPSAPSFPTPPKYLVMSMLFTFLNIKKTNWIQKQLSAQKGYKCYLPGKNGKFLVWMYHSLRSFISICQKVRQ